MNYTAIKVDDYWVIVSDEEIKVDDYAFNGFSKNLIVKAEIDNNVIGWRSDKTHFFFGTKAKKVIACSKELNGLPVFVPEWENEESNIEVAAQQYVLSRVENSRAFAPTSLRLAWYAGFNTAKEKYQFTEEDMIRFAEWTWLETYKISGYDNSQRRAIFQKFLALTKPKQYQVEIGSVSDNRIEVKSWKEI